MWSHCNQKDWLCAGLKVRYEVYGEALFTSVIGGCIAQTWIPYNVQAGGRHMSSAVRASEKGIFLAGWFLSLVCRDDADDECGMSTL